MSCARLYFSPGQLLPYRLAEICKIRLWNGNLFIEAPLGGPGTGSGDRGNRFPLPGTFRNCFKKTLETDNLSLYRDSTRES
jgi:hypothetical protein